VSAKDVVIDYLRKNGPCSGTEIASSLGVSRQAVNRHLRALIEEGSVLKVGETRGAQYHLPGADEEIFRPKQFERILKLTGLAEDRVFEEVGIVLNLASMMQKNALAILRYAFTEVLNNAIEHSDSDKCQVKVVVSDYSVGFSIRDFGVGIFTRIREYFDLNDEYDALRELLKGKRTVSPEAHTGEGLFFTSRLGDIVTIHSHEIALSFLNDRGDLETGEITWLKGTDVTFSISRRTKKRLQEVFDVYAPEEFDYSFARSEVRVKLYQHEYVSRSEGRRLVAGLESFQHVVLNFSSVTSIQQGFADEIFRVFRNAHPQTELSVEMANPAICQMIRHVKGMSEAC
jgi:biotin operon repressor/anti-sigma regulatory factor (Ser/Thr protein kinase)